MKLTALVDNIPDEGKVLQSEHGLSFWLQTDEKNILIDTGATSLFADNARKIGINIADAHNDGVIHQEVLDATLDSCRLSVQKRGGKSFFQRLYAQFVKHSWELSPLREFVHFKDAEAPRTFKAEHIAVIKVYEKVFMLSFRYRNRLHPDHS